MTECENGPVVLFSLLTPMSLCLDYLYGSPRAALGLNKYPCEQTCRTYVPAAFGTCQKKGTNAILLPLTEIGDCIYPSLFVFIVAHGRSLSEK